MKCIHITHANHMTDHQWTYLVMTWLPWDKRKREHKVVRHVLEFDCLHFAKYISIRPHGIDCKLFVVRIFITWIEPSDWIPWHLLNGPIDHNGTFHISLDKSLLYSSGVWYNNKTTRVLSAVWHYAVLWLVFTWSPYPWYLVEITPVLTTFGGYYLCVHYFYIPWFIMTSQWLMTLLGMPHCGATMGNDVAMGHPLWHHNG